MSALKRGDSRELPLEKRVREGLAEEVILVTFELRPKGKEGGHMEKREKGLWAEVTAGAKAPRKERAGLFTREAPCVLTQ